MKFAVLLVGALLCSADVLQAQTASVASGGDATGPGGSASFSVGQAADITAVGTAGAVAQGVQQPYDDVSTAVEGPDPVLAAFVYPSITSDLVQVEIPDAAVHAWHLELVDALGRTLIQRSITGPRTELSLAALAAGTYRLLIVAAGERFDTFTLVKVDRP